MPQLCFLRFVMPVITGLKMNRDKTRARLYLDGSYAFTLSCEIALKNNLKAGQNISENRAEKLKSQHEQLSCFNSACRLISYRPRCEREIKERLERKGFNHEPIQQTIDRLKEKGLINDAAFARFWAENRASFKPQSSSLTLLELKRKGLTEQEAREAVKDHDDFENACRAALSRAKKMPPLDYEVFYRRLGSFLKRRGFSYGAIKPVIEKTWNAINSENLA